MLTDEFLKLFFDAVLFGIVDNGVMLVGAFFGLGLEKYLPGRLQVGLGAIIGAGLGNTVSDFYGWGSQFKLGTSIWNRIRVFNCLNFNTCHSYHKKIKSTFLSVK